MCYVWRVWKRNKGNEILKQWDDGDDDGTEEEAHEKI